MRFFVLDKHPLGERDWHLDVLTEHHGRISIRCPYKVCPNPDIAQIYDGQWPSLDQNPQPFNTEQTPSGRWPTLVWLNVDETMRFDGQNIYCVVYLLELLARLLPYAESVPRLFEQCRTTFNALAADSMPEPWLRLFENQLLQCLGYAFDWHTDIHGDPINAHLRYHFDPELGFGASANGAYDGAVLLSFNHDNITQCRGWPVIKHILKRAIDHVLAEHNARLHSRDLLLNRHEPQHACRATNQIFEHTLSM